MNCEASTTLDGLSKGQQQKRFSESLHIFGGMKVIKERNKAADVAVNILLFAVIFSQQASALFGLGVTHLPLFIE